MPVSRIEQQRTIIRQIDARACNHAYTGCLLPIPASHDTRDTAAIDEAERLVALQRGGGKKLLG